MGWVFYWLVTWFGVFSVWRLGGFGLGRVFDIFVRVVWVFSGTAVVSPTPFSSLSMLHVHISEPSCTAGIVGFSLSCLCIPQP